MIESRTGALVLTAACVLQVGLTAAGLPGWPCAFRVTTGIPCPGCGLTRATVALLRGRIQESFALHAFAAVVIIVAGVLAISIVLPAHARASLAKGVGQVEQRLPLALLTLGALLLYWLWRLLYTPVLRTL